MSLIGIIEAQSAVVASGPVSLVSAVIDNASPNQVALQFSGPVNSSDVNQLVLKGTTNWQLTNTNNVNISGSGANWTVSLHAPVAGWMDVRLDFPSLSIAGFRVSNNVNYTASNRPFALRPLVGKAQKNMPRNGNVIKVSTNSWTDSSGYEQVAGNSGNNNITVLVEAGGNITGEGSSPQVTYRGDSQSFHGQFAPKPLLIRNAEHILPVDAFNFYLEHLSFVRGHTDGTSDTFRHGKQDSNLAERDPVENYTAYHCLYGGGRDETWGGIVKNLTISHCIIADTLRRGADDAHAFPMLIYGDDDYLNDEFLLELSYLVNGKDRFPLTRHSSNNIINNFLGNSSQRILFFASEFSRTVRANVIGNIFAAGPMRDDPWFVKINCDSGESIRIYFEDNWVLEQDGTLRPFNPSTDIDYSGGNQEGITIEQNRINAIYPDNCNPMSAKDVIEYLRENVGPRPDMRSDMPYVQALVDQLPTSGNGMTGPSTAIQTYQDYYNYPQIDAGASDGWQTRRMPTFGTNEQRNPSFSIPADEWATDTDEKYSRIEFAIHNERP